jgi:hypothetical protein
MKKYYLLAISLAFVLTIATVPALAQNKSTTPGENPNITWTLLTPQAGAVLKAGSQVLVTWDMTLDREFVANEWAEMEYVTRVEVVARSIFAIGTCDFDTVRVAFK